MKAEVRISQGRIYTPVHVPALHAGREGTNIKIVPVSAKPRQDASNPSTYRNNFLHALEVKQRKAQPQFPYAQQYKDTFRLLRKGSTIVNEGPVSKADFLSSEPVWQAARVDAGQSPEGRVEKPASRKERKKNRRLAATFTGERLIFLKRPSHTDRRNIMKRNRLTVHEANTLSHVRQEIQALQRQPIELNFQPTRTEYAKPLQQAVQEASRFIIVPGKTEAEEKQLETVRAQLQRVDGGQQTEQAVPQETARILVSAAKRLRKVKLRRKIRRVAVEKRKSLLMQKEKIRKNTTLMLNEKQKKRVLQKRKKDAKERVPLQFVEDQRINERRIQYGIKLLTKQQSTLQERMFLYFSSFGLNSRIFLPRGFDGGLRRYLDYISANGNTFSTLKARRVAEMGVRYFPAVTVGRGGSPVSKEYVKRVVRGVKFQEAEAA